MATKAPSSPHGTLVWLSCVRAYNLCEAVMTARLAELGLRVGEHEVLATIATTPGITQQALAARCFVAKSGVSMLIAQLESRGWVLRESDGADARVKRLSLTPDGLAVAQQTLAIQADVVRAMVDSASEADMATVTRVMDHASEALETMRAAPSLEPARGRAAKAKSR
ncbi:MAG: MarR family transcriptional regulator [Comamonadaceae bacterium]|nr:MAG: MarR family transcriptional regulator [Comamonadaceae bacterium]